MDNSWFYVDVDDVDVDLMLIADVNFGISIVSMAHTRA